VLRRVPPFLPDKVRAEFEQMLTPEALGIMAATLAVWAVSHFAGVGFIVDILLLVAGAVFLGMAVFRAAGLILDALAATRDATSEADLDTAARLLAEAIAIIGVGTFMALLARVAGKVRPRRGGRATPGTASKPPPEPVPPPTGQTAPPKPAAPPGPVPTPPKQLSFKPSQLQKKYKHAPDFGCPPNYSPENASRFEAALRQHVAAPQTRTIPGEYGRGASPQQVLHHFDPSTGRNVMTDTQGNFISAWKLSADQQRHLLTTGRLGGG
jgi:hypothetical protein